MRARKKSTGGTAIEFVCKDKEKHLCHTNQQDVPAVQKRQGKISFLHLFSRNLAQVKLK